MRRELFLISCMLRMFHRKNQGSFLYDTRLVCKETFCAMRDDDMLPDDFSLSHIVNHLH